MSCHSGHCTLEGAIFCSISALNPNQWRKNVIANKTFHGVFVCAGIQINTKMPIYSRYVKVSFSFSKRCICTVVKYIHRQGFSIAIEERGGETQGLGEYNIVQTSWLGTAVAPCRPDCPCRSVLMSGSLPPSHGPSFSSVRGVTG